MNYVNNINETSKKQKFGMMATDLPEQKERLLQIYSMYNPKSVVDAMISTMDWTEVMESVSASAVR